MGWHSCRGQRVQELLWELIRIFAILTDDAIDAGVDGRFSWLSGHNLIVQTQGTFIRGTKNDSLDDFFRVSGVNNLTKDVRDYVTYSEGVSECTD